MLWLGRSEKVRTTHCSVAATERPSLFLPPAVMSASLNLDEEVRLYTTNAEREKYGMLATLFGIVIALEYLERAYVRDSVTAAE